jgi:benzodiazapine receptor
MGRAYAASGTADGRGKPRGRSEISSGGALFVVAGVLAAAGLISRRYSPDPSHPRIRQWYDELEKPSYKPPDPVFGAAWPVLETVHSYGAYRLMRLPRTPERDAALALWLLNISLVTGWAKIFFGERNITGAAVESAAIVASSTAFIERASRVDGIAAASAVPFALWSAFGGAMTEHIRERNPGMDSGQD